MNYELSRDLSAITTISQASIDKLLSDATLCIGHAVAETSSASENVASIDIGFGQLDIAFDGKEAKYRFTPNLKLRRAVASALDGTSPLMVEAEQIITGKILKAYKELF